VTAHGGGNNPTGNLVRIMKIERIENVIATRRLWLAADSANRQVIVMLGKPEKLPGEYENYYCPFIISGMGDDICSYGAGIDAFQALQEAMRAIGVSLYLDLNPQVNGRLRWEGDEEGDLGFPRVEVVR
jgi:hypothetical protein